MYKKDSYQLTAKILPNIMMLKVLKEEKFLKNIKSLLFKYFKILVAIIFLLSGLKTNKRP